jgi:hypothetical protein
MKHKIKHVHFVGIGGAAMSSEQGPAMCMAGCERLRVGLPADYEAWAKRT